MHPPRVHTLPTASQLFDHCARQICSTINSTLARQAEFHLVLSGGETPIRLYQALLALPEQPQVAWSRCHIWLGDERYVALDHPESNYHSAQQHLLQHLPIPTTQIHPYATHLPPVEAAAEYAATIDRHLGSDPQQRQFDLILLGLGNDGHIASLFPATPALDEDRAWVVANPVARLDRWRLTLTYPALNSARHLYLLVSGQGKAAMVKQILSPATGKPLPAQRLATTALEWFIDTDAASQLSTDFSARDH
jgi:6-phosphogluconolactonase